MNWTAGDMLTTHYFRLKKSVLILLQNCLNYFDKNIRFNVYTFQDENIYFLDIETGESKTNVYH